MGGGWGSITSMLVISGRLMLIRFSIGQCLLCSDLFS